MATVVSDSQRYHHLKALAYGYHVELDIAEAQICTGKRCSGRPAPVNMEEVRELELAVREAFEDALCSAEDLGYGWHELKGAIVAVAHERLAENNAA